MAFGNHTISAVYGGDANFAGDTANAVTQTVLYATSTTVVSSSNPAIYSETVTLTATVTASVGVPTGTVTFFDYGITLGTATVDSSSTATFTSSSLSLGDNFVTAVYGGDVNNAASTSDFLDQTVNPAGTATTITSSLNPALFGQAVTLTAAVRPYHRHRERLRRPAWCCSLKTASRWAAVLLTAAVRPRSQAAVYPWATTASLLCMPATAISWTAHPICSIKRSSRTRARPSSRR